MILVGGEALVDLVVGDGDEVGAHLGGGPFNCARTLGRLEQPVAYLGRISSDRFGARLREQLEADGVSLAAVVATDDPTTLALAELDAEGAAAYRFYDDGTSAPGLTVEDALAALPGRRRDAPRRHARARLRADRDGDRGGGRADRGLGARDARPQLPPERDHRPGGLPRAAGPPAARCHVVKASDADLDYLDPGRSDLDAARALLELGPPVVLLTRGARGATVLTADGETEVAAPRIEVADTIGAGDAFGGGFLPGGGARAWARPTSGGPTPCRGDALRLPGGGADVRAPGRLAAAARRA